MFKELLNSFTNTMIEVNVVKGEAYNNVMRIYDMFTTSEGLDVNEYEVYNNVWFMVSSREAKTVKRLLKNIDGVISVR